MDARTGRRVVVGRSEAVDIGWENRSKKEAAQRVKEACMAWCRGAGRDLHSAADTEQVIAAMADTTTALLQTPGVEPANHQALGMITQAARGWMLPRHQVARKRDGGDEVEMLSWLAAALRTLLWTRWQHLRGRRRQRRAEARCRYLAVAERQALLRGGRTATQAEARVLRDMVARQAMPWFGSGMAVVYLICN